MNYLKNCGLIGVLFVCMFVLDACKPDRPKTKPMPITLKMPLTSITDWGTLTFPNDLLGYIDISVSADNFVTKNYRGTFSFDCNTSTSSMCPKRGEFSIEVPETGNFTLNVTARTNTCSSSFYKTCQSTQGNRTGALLKFEWNLGVSDADVSRGGSYQLIGNLQGRAGNPIFSVKCCCQPTQIDKMCGVQPNGQAYNSCVPTGFEIDNGYTGVCGADREEFKCIADDEQEPDQNGNCGKPCNSNYPCANSKYQCSSSTTTSGICQLPCSSNLQCPTGMGCNTGWCR